MNLSWQSSFRALFSGLVLADLENSLAAPGGKLVGRGGSPYTWRTLLIETAQKLGQGLSPDGAGLTLRMQQLEAEDPVALALGLLPLLLTWDDLGQEGRALAAWSGYQTLQPEAQTVLAQLQHLLRRGWRRGPSISMPFRGASPDQAAYSRRFDWLTVGPDCHPILAEASRRVQQAQGQYALALGRRSSCQSSMALSLLPLVGLLAALAEGLAGIPLAWRLHLLNSPNRREVLQHHWGIGGEETLWQLADALFYRWVGVYPTQRNDSRSIYPVSQVELWLMTATGKTDL